MAQLLIDVEERLQRVAETLHLTKAEARELRLMVAGFSGPESAMAQDLAKNTVQKRRKDVLHALDASCSLEAVARALGLCQLADEALAKGLDGEGSP